jgi:hypothetical protein
MVRTCLKCASPIPRKASNYSTRKYCGRPCYVSAIAFDMEQRRIAFWLKVDASGGNDACWIWQGARSISNYGTFRWFGHNINAHRAAYLLTHGPIKPGLDVLHTCHNGVGGCVNPRHLYLGTDHENMRDKKAAGRTHKTFRKLGLEKARAIKAVKGKVRAAVLAASHGVCIRSIHAIWSGKTWRNA